MGVKFCGGCNPQIERTRFVDELKKKLPEDLCLTHSDNTEKWELGIMVCGCPVACADRPATRNLSFEWIFVNGPAIDLELFSENELATIVALKIQKYFEGRNPYEVA